MFRLAADVQVYLHREAIDFRIGINGLAILVEQAMHLDPFRRAVFAFCNRRRDRIRLLFYDRSAGLWPISWRSVGYGGFPIDDVFHDSGLDCVPINCRSEPRIVR
jgi:hypothetical protein